MLDLVQPHLTGVGLAAQSWKESNLERSVKGGRSGWKKEFTEQEIKAALDSIKGDKAPGPDGFNFKFIKACWEVMGPDFFKVFKEFYYNGVLHKGLKNSCHPCTKKGRIVRTDSL